MNEPNRYSDTFSKTASNNRWYRWLAAGTFILAMGLLTVYILQRLGLLQRVHFDHRGKPTKDSGDQA